MNTLLIGLAVALGAPGLKEAPKDGPPKLEGDWSVESGVGGGDKGPPGSIVMRFTAGHVKIIEGQRERAEEADIAVDFKAKPATIDIRPGKGKGGGDEVIKGIIEIKGDDMKLCFVKGAGERPKEFKGDDQKRIVCITLKRIKADK